MHWLLQVHGRFYFFENSREPRMDYIYFLLKLRNFNVKVLEIYGE